MFYGNKEFLKALCVESLIDHKIGCKCDIFFSYLFVFLLNSYVIKCRCNVCRKIFAEVEEFFFLWNFICNISVEYGPFFIFYFYFVSYKIFM